MLTVGVFGNDALPCPPSYSMDVLLILTVVVYSHDLGVIHIRPCGHEMSVRGIGFASTYQWSRWMRVPDGSPLNGYAGGKCKMVHMLWSLQVTPYEEYSEATWFGGT